MPGLAGVRGCRGISAHIVHTDVGTPEDVAIVGLDGSSGRELVHVLNASAWGESEFRV